MSYDAQEQSTAGSQAFELYQFTNASGAYYLTSADQAISYLGATYTPTTIERTEFEYSNEVTCGQLHIKIPENHGVAQTMIPYLTPSPTKVQIFGGHYGDSEIVRLFVGTVSAAEFSYECDMLVNSDAYILQRKIPKQGYLSPCAHIFGDLGCGINLPSLTLSAGLGSVSTDGLTITSSAFAGLPHALAGGYLRFGNEYRMIMTHSGSTITILSAISGMAAGSVVTVAPGCQLTYAACQGYNNVANFLGFDLIPTINPFTEAIV